MPDALIFCKKAEKGGPGLPIMQKKAEELQMCAENNFEIPNILGVFCGKFADLTNS